MSAQTIIVTKSFREAAERYAAARRAYMLADTLTDAHDRALAAAADDLAGWAAIQIFGDEWRRVGGSDEYDAKCIAEDAARRAAKEAKP